MLVELFLGIQAVHIIYAYSSVWYQWGSQE